jgi:hypothetical protein
LRALGLVLERRTASLDHKDFACDLRGRVLQQRRGCVWHGEHNLSADHSCDARCKDGELAAGELCAHGG